MAKRYRFAKILVVGRPACCGLCDSVPSPRCLNEMTTAWVATLDDCEGDFEPDGDVDGSDLAQLIDSGGIDIDYLNFFQQAVLRSTH